MLTPLARRTYAPRGQTPIQRCWDRRDRISAISAITLSPVRQRLGLYFQLLPDNRNVRAQNVVEFLRLLLRQLRRPMTIIWDRSNVHQRALVVRDFLCKHRRIVTAQLPAYAPELNPDEGVWSYTKYARLANFAPTDSDHLRSSLLEEFTRLKSRKELLAGFIEHSKLPLNL